MLLKKVKNNVPLSYTTEDLNREELGRRFYGKELQKANQTEFIIEKVITRKGNKLHVKWKGYDDSFNSWIDKTNIVI